jgi:proteasome alpha subunit
MFSAIGQQADVESLRISAVDFAHQEGYQRSESDVTIGRLVGFALSGPMKRAFGDITTAPFVINALFTELAETPADDAFVTLRYDGDFSVAKKWSAVAGTPEVEERMRSALQTRWQSSMSLDQAITLAEEIWQVGADRDGSGEPDPEILSDAHPEIGILDRQVTRERRFQLIELPARETK